MRRFCRVFPVALLLMSAFASAAPSDFSIQRSDTPGSEGSFLRADGSIIDPTPSSTNLSDESETGFDLTSLAGSMQANPFTGDSQIVLPTEFSTDPLSKIFSQPIVISVDPGSIRTEAIAQPQPPILVPALDTIFVKMPELDVLLVILIAAVLYRVGARVLRFNR